MYGLAKADELTHFMILRVNSFAFLDRLKNMNAFARPYIIEVSIFKRYESREKFTLTFENIWP